MKLFRVAKTDFESQTVLIPILCSLRIDGDVSWSWFAITAPLWIPLGLAVPLLMFAPVGVYMQYTAAKDDSQLIMQARATCMGCLATTVFLGCIAGSAGMLCAKLDGNAVANWTFQQAMIPLYVFEGVLLLTYVGASLRVAAEGLVWKAMRVTFLVLLAMRLDGADIWWSAVLAPLAAWVRTCVQPLNSLPRVPRCALVQKPLNARSYQSTLRTDCAASLSFAAMHSRRSSAQQTFRRLFVHPRFCVDCLLSRHFPPFAVVTAASE